MAQRVPIVLSWGLGADSTAILLRWLSEAEARSFDLADLIVVHASTGNEFGETARLCDIHVLPLLRARGIRTVQVARAGPSAARDGIVWLEDSRAPSRIHAEGAYSLAEENLVAGTIPQLAGRRCSVKAKGEVLDAALAELLGSGLYRHAIGYEANETRRAERDGGFGTAAREPWYPLIEWGWDRADCLAYLAMHTGVDPWPKSACVYCPFTAVSERNGLMDRYRREPAAGALAVRLERVARRLNPAARLFGTVAVEDLVRQAQVDEAISLAEATEEHEPWAVWRVRRIVWAKGRAWRSVEKVEVGSRGACIAEVGRLGLRSGATVRADDGIERWWLHERGPAFPTTEEFYVAGPAIVGNKARPTFESRWDEVTGAGRLFGWEAVA